MIVIFAFIMFYLVSYVLNPYSRWWVEYINSSYYEILGEMTITFLFCVIMSESSIFMHKLLNKRFPWTQAPLKRLSIETIANIILVLILIFLQVLIHIALSGEEKREMSPQDLTDFAQFIVVSILIGLMISGINTGNFLIMNWKSSAMEALENKVKAAQHEQAAAEAELLALKLQIDPHFVFNNLSVLSELILEDQQLGYEYAENFSKVYRYLLLNAKKDLISLADEIKFIHAYIFLLQQRAGTGVQFNIEIDPVLNHLHIPPLTLQLLIENALKHNKLLKDDPLKISIKGTDFEELTVSNGIKALDRKPVSAGIGLDNIKKRYRLLGKALPIIVQDSQQFTVIVPLIKL